MPSMRVICSGASTSSFWKRSDCHHFPWAEATPGTASTIADKTRQMNRLRRVFILEIGYDQPKAGVYGRTVQVITGIRYFCARKPGRSARVVDEGQFVESA